MNEHVNFRIKSLIVIKITFDQNQFMTSCKAEKSVPVGSGFWLKIFCVDPCLAAYFFLNPFNNWWKIYCIERVTFIKIWVAFEFHPMMHWIPVIQLPNTEFCTFIISSYNKQTVPSWTETNLININLKS